MIRLITMSMIVWCTVTSLSAQNMDEMRSSSPEERAARQTKWMNSELSLDSVTQVNVFNVNLKYAKANQVIFNSAERKIIKLNKIKSNKASKDKELRTVLSKEQYEKYLITKDTMKQSNVGKIKEKR